MKRATRPWSGRRIATRGAVAVLATATAATLTGTAATPAQSAIGGECPEAFPIAQLADGDAVDGLTVTKGTEPGEFTGKVIDVLDDGIMPGIDMIMVRLGSDDPTASTVDKRISEVGIWSGMSGSPVYAEDGRLIGAVAYGLSYGPSTVAGVTPAAQMQELLESGGAAERRTGTVDLPERTENRIVASGAATEAQAESGMRQLKVMGLSGLSQNRFNKVTKKLDIRGVERMMLGTAGADEIDASAIKAGGNLAAAVSYGDISFAGVGTATMVCGEEVVGFGHPMMWQGPTGLSLHPADSLYIQEDPAWSGFKVANLGGPVGTIDEDRMAGIAGFLGDAPTPATITSHVTSPTDERTGESFVNVDEWVPDVALFHLLTNEDRVFDGVGEGSGTVSWTIEGTREDGTPFELTRSDVYASEWDLTWETAWDLYMALARMEYTNVEDVSIDDVETDSDLNRDYKIATITDVRVKEGGEWVSLDDLRRLVLEAGSNVRLQVDVATMGEETSTMDVIVPILKKDAGRRGWLEVSGGNRGSGWYFGGRNMPFDKLLDRLENAAHNDDVIVGLHYWRTKRSERNVTREDRISNGGVPVEGGDGVRLRIVD